MILGDYPREKNPSNASISHTGSVVTITCTPEEGSSCVVVYRAYGNSTLNTYNKEFPVTITVDQSIPRNYTFAIFRKMNDKSVYRNPFISQVVMVGSVSPPKTGNGKYAFGSSIYIPCTTSISFLHQNMCSF